MKDLNVLHLPLNGIRLIEASAGTGKTYNLIIIYLRLLLNIENSSSCSHPLTVKEILVVTFTKSAVQDLKTRIKENIRLFRLDCIQGYSHNPLFSKLLTRIYNKNYAITLLSTAETEINQASIFTIHGFCQRILTENIIEFNMLFQTSIIENESLLYQQMCSDFWRRHFYSLPLNITKLIQQHWKDPIELFKDIFPYIYKEIPKLQYSQFIHESNKNIATHYQQIINCINSIKNQWIKKQHHITNVINTNNFNRKIYNKKNLTYWMHNIHQWITNITLDHMIPNNLDYFRSSTLQINKNVKNSHTFSLFYLIEELYQRFLSFKELIFSLAINEIQQNLITTKYFRSEITFHDLIDAVLCSGIENKKNKIAQKITTCYPFAIIDEFQDTDPNQYKIFHALYSNNSKNGLILIGDPKQAIYGFRGADIFTYIKIRRSLPNKYNLNINWRSSTGLINAVNQLFNIPNPFIFKDIPFIPSSAIPENNMYQFIISNKPQPPIYFWLYSSDNAVSIHDYKTKMAKECAITLQKLQYHIHNKTAWLIKNKHKKKLLQTSDIVILIRNHEEASMIQSELSKINMPTIFLSNRTNIFETIESYELLLLLKAILFPTQKSICTALTTIFFNFNAIKIENINNNESEWEQIFEEFSEYYFIWTKQSILSMIQKIIFRHKTAEILLSKKNEQHKLINILHLGELLNNIAKEITNEYELIQWLESKMTKSHYNQNTQLDYMLRSINKKELIKISTIHKSKGLEFPLTFLPFISSFNYNKNYVFHDRKSFTLHTNFDKSKLNLKLLDEERLSEDLRLLYVAITRSIYHCSIGIAPIIHGNYKKKSPNTDFHRSAVGYLIQNTKPDSAQSLQQHLQKLNLISKGDISFREITKNPQYLNSTIIQSFHSQHLCSKKWTPLKHIYNHTWSMISYSNIKNTITSMHSCLQPLLNINLNSNHTKQDNKNISTLFTPHTFPKGKTYGIFFHNLFENLNFQKLIDKKWLQIHMLKYNINPNWETIIYKWIDTIINTPIDRKSLKLSKITSIHKYTELKFFLPINTYLDSQKLDRLCKNYDSLSSQSPILTFPEITGMLQGSIDLIFYWNRKYYLLDYKTNWLGENNDFYSKNYIEKSIIDNRYELQYQLYTLALHRFLQHRIISYNYEKDFGGIYYLFIRGIDGTSYSNGIYFCRPLWIFIKKLDNLFSNKTKYY